MTLTFPNHQAFRPRTFLLASENTPLFKVLRQGQAPFKTKVNPPADLDPLSGLPECSKVDSCLQALIATGYLCGPMLGGRSPDVEAGQGK